MRKIPQKQGFLEAGDTPPHPLPQPFDASYATGLETPRVRSMLRSKKARLRAITLHAKLYIPVSDWSSWRQ